MKHRKLGIVLPVVVIIWTTLIILLDLSNMGQRWYYIADNLKRIGLEETLLFLTLIAAGCFIGLVPFAKRKYNARIALSIPRFSCFFAYTRVL